MCFPAIRISGISGGYLTTTNAVRLFLKRTCTIWFTLEISVQHIFFTFSFVFWSPTFPSGFPGFPTFLSGSPIFPLFSSRIQGELFYERKVINYDLRTIKYFQLSTYQYRNAFWTKIQEYPFQSSFSKIYKQNRQLNICTWGKGSVW